MIQREGVCGAVQGWWWQESKSAIVEKENHRRAKFKEIKLSVLVVTTMVTESG